VAKKPTKKTGVQSGRNGAFSYGEGKTAYKKKSDDAIGEKTTVRSGAKSSKTYISPKTVQGAQVYMKKRK